MKKFCKNCTVETERYGNGKCAPCNRKSRREARTRKPGAEKEQKAVYDKSRAAKHRALMERVKAAPCMDCGQRFPACAMDFDHVCGKKEFGVGQGRDKSEFRVLREIEKCDLVCANCHRIRTALRHA